MREALLSYLTYYGHEKCLTFKSFKMLFQNHEDSTLDVRFLDLTGLLNEDFTINDLAKSLKRILSHISADLGSLSIGEFESKGKEKATVDVADSWEEEADDQATADAVLPAQLTTPHFANLSRLSLAHPGEWASWSDLLKVSVNLHKLTHLSLAYWPRPTSTPNSVTSSVETKYTKVALGGTSYYAELDDDWHEAANILRRFSINTYSLEWLDLEGCSWIRALTWRPPCHPEVSSGLILPPELLPYASSYRDPGWYDTQISPGPDWNDSWQRITYLHIFQGWIPADKTSLQNMPAGIVPVHLMRWLRENQDQEEHGWKFNTQERGHAVAQWVNREKVLRTTGMDLQRIRRDLGGAWCKIDYGWGGDGGENAS
ncbi:hypothetical protein GQ44DRAFT_707107 [Phaeosphaeriaceae sp. PMI808]|nr:hypothetical protein GQ44DRAFT_707107 [Phaeosphaeriaceae sp. PMI808]